jgi:hypothetical protein
VRRIPKSFGLLGHTITVKIINQKEWKYANEWGWWDPAKNEILLVRQPRTQLRHSFWHEVSHAILDLMGQAKLSANEAFVDQMGGLLAQMMDSTEF